MTLRPTWSTQSSRKLGLESETSSLDKQKQRSREILVRCLPYHPLPLQRLTVKRQHQNLGEALVHLWIRLNFSPAFSICHDRSRQEATYHVEFVFLFERSDGAKFARLGQGRRLHAATPSLVPAQREPWVYGRCCRFVDSAFESPPFSF